MARPVRVLRIAFADIRGNFMASLALLVLYVFVLSRLGSVAAEAATDKNRSGRQSHEAQGQEGHVTSTGERKDLRGTVLRDRSSRLDDIGGGRCVSTCHRQ